MSPQQNAGTDPVALARLGWQALLRYRVRAIAVFAVVSIVAVVGALLLPREYESSAKLLVKIGRESVTLDPTATVGQTLSVYDSRETEVNTILEIIGSRAVLEDVVAELGPATVLGEATATSGQADSRTAVEQAVRALQETTSVERGRKSNVVTVAARAKSPELARQITTAMLDAFDGRYLVANRTAGSYDFFRQQERVVADELAQATGELNSVRNDLGVGSVEGERRRIETRLAALDTDRSTNETALAAAEARIAELERSVQSLPERRVTQEVTGFAEDARGRTRQQLSALRLAEHELLTRYAETHPDVLAVRERIARAERTLASSADAGNTQSTTVANPAREQLELELLRERSNAEALRGRSRELGSLKAEAVARLRQLNDSEARLVELASRVDRLRVDHTDYAKALEQARIDRALAEEKISNVNVFQPPTFVSKPVGSQRRLVAFLGLVLATLSALGVAWGSALLDRHRPADSANPVTPGPPAERPSLRSQLAATMAR